MECKQCGIEIFKGDICESCFNTFMVEQDKKYRQKNHIKDMITKLEDVLETLYYLQEQELTLPEKMGKQLASIFKEEK